MRNNIKNTNGPWRVLRRLLPVWFAVAVALSLGSADAWAKGNVSPPPVAATPAPGQEEIARTLSELPIALPLGMVDDDLLEYAQREAQAQGLENFEGGAILIIGGSALALVVVLLLLIILL
jgi:hypothetical protein